MSIIVNLSCIQIKVHTHVNYTAYIQNSLLLLSVFHLRFNISKFILYTDKGTYTCELYLTFKTLFFLVSFSLDSISVIYYSSCIQIKVHTHVNYTAYIQNSLLLLSVFLLRFNISKFILYTDKGTYTCELYSLHSKLSSS